jgi:metal-responsive CopG/Arc/MetJ family transcriptional regulator
MRTIVEIPEDKIDALADYCSKKSISRAKAIRDAIGVLLAEKGGMDREKGFGLWKGRKFEAGKFLDEIRAEWGKR